jgi:hypothetical protein
MFKVVPRRLRFEVREIILLLLKVFVDFVQKGQYLDPFLISLINYAEPAKPKATQPSPVFNDIIVEKVKIQSVKIYIHLLFL